MTIYWVSKDQEKILPENDGLSPDSPISYQEAMSMVTGKKGRNMNKFEEGNTTIDLDFCKVVINKDAKLIEIYGRSHKVGDMTIPGFAITVSPIWAKISNASNINIDRCNGKVSNSVFNASRCVLSGGDNVINDFLGYRLGVSKKKGE